MNKRHIIAVTSTIVGLIAIVLVALAVAQGPRRPPTDPDHPARPDRGVTPIGFDMGDIVSADPATNTLTYVSARDREEKVVKVADNAILTRHGPSALADVKVGEYITVRGNPTGIVARTMETSESPMAIGGVAPPAAGPPGSTPGGAPPSSRLYNGSEATVSGKVIETSPLTVEVDAENKIVVQSSDKTPAEVSHTGRIKLADLQKGEYAFIRGENDKDGKMTATSISVDPTRRPPGLAPKPVLPGSGDPTQPKEVK